MRRSIRALEAALVVALFAAVHAPVSSAAAEDVCATTTVSGVVNNTTGPVCVPTPLSTAPSSFEIGQPELLHFDFDVTIP